MVAPVLKTLYGRRPTIIGSGMIVDLKALCLSQGRGILIRWPFLAGFVLGLAFLTAVTGCRTEKGEPQFKDVKELARHDSVAPATNAPVGVNSDSIVLREGDTLKISFLGAPQFNNNPVIRQDGKIGLYLIGEIKAAGLTPAELEKEIKERYKGQIVVNEVMVTVESNSLTVYVTGAVLHPQKVVSNHPITALEAVMEAGGPDFTKANLKEVSVLRQEPGHVKKFVLNLKDILSGKSNEQFYLKNGDIIYIREKFSVF